MIYYYLKYKKVFISILIFLFIIFILGFAVNNWGITGDDGGLLCHSRIKNIKDLLNFFCSDVTANNAGSPSNYQYNKQTFFAVYYRPLTYIFYYFQNIFFNYQAYYYFLFNIFLHAVNAVLLFNIFLYFSGYILAFLMALTFAFHVSMCTWLGWIASQVYQIELFFILLIILFLKKYLESKKILYYLFALLFFLFAIFTRELSVIMPIWLVLAFITFNCYKNNKLNFYNNFLYSFKLSLGFWFIWGFYFLLRLYFYPINNAVHSNFSINSFRFLFNRYPDFITLISNLANQSIYFLPGGNFKFKAILVLLYFVPFIFLFMINKNKKYILFFIFSMCLFLWPAILHLYVDRYLYPVLPFYLIIVLILLKINYKQDNLSIILYKKIIIIFLYLLLPFDIYILRSGIKYQSISYYQKELYFNKILNNKNLKNKKVCFLCLPAYLFYNSIAQYLWIKGFNKSFDIYYDDRTFIAHNFPEKQNNPEIIKLNNGFKFIIKDVNKQSFLTYRGNIMGNLITDKYLQDKPVELTLYLDKKYLDPDIKFITWDYSKNEFKIL
ncbi:MAG: hypothetical protein SZ59_C0002G0301 [candidate division TM6 bacterium GW2011_GWF2_28_16]|nr:MAG: hypothetical protein SZ59_C0002G0301 [candidate division TM6 bacterium GW2011_GWF2_28_16]